MDINRANLDTLNFGLNESFQAGMEAKIEEQLFQLATEVPSFSASNIYIWLNRIPGFREWFEGTGRKFQDVVSNKFQVFNREFEESIRFGKNELADNSSGALAGLYGPVGVQLGMDWIELKVKTLINVVLDNATAWDGTAFFADTRTGNAYGSNNIDNLTTNSLSATNFEAALVQMSQYKWGNNQNIKVRPTVLVCGETLRVAAWNILKNSKVSSSSAAIDNANQGSVELVVTREFNPTAGENSDVDAEHYWGLFDLSNAINPVVLQIREEATNLMDTDPARVKREGFVDWLSNGRLTALPTHPHLALLSQATS